MLRASTLYIVIILALVIAIICSSLIVSAYFYKMQYQKKFRYDVLQDNMSSGVNILLNTQDSSYLHGQTISLFGNGTDSISLKMTPWGIYDIEVVKAFIQKDTVYKVFSVANIIDSTKWAALYLIDEDRPMSVSGKTMIRGEAYIPKAGIKEAYVDNKAYTGDKNLIIGKKHHSDKKLPVLLPERLSELEHTFMQKHSTDTSWFKNDSLRNSFLLATKCIDFGKKVKTLKNSSISGNIMLFSDTAIIIDSSAVLNNIIVFAKSIKVASGFKGNCQLFASDSISVGQHCNFNYPSCLGLLCVKSPMVGTQAKISIGNNCSFIGMIFTYEKNEGTLKPLIDLGKNVKIGGQVYSQGIVGLQDHVEIDGSIYTAKFLYKNSFTLFENYLINTTIDSKSLSPYYLTSELLPVSGKKKKILQWLEAN